MQYIAFFAALPHAYADYLEETLLEYSSVTQYIIGMETTPDTHQDSSGQHFHFFTDMSSKDYHTYSIRIFRNKYNLRGQAIKDHPRQYGKIKQIHDLDKMAAYTLKDGNIRTNMEKNIIAQYIALSHRKAREKDLREELFIFLKSKNETDPYTLRTFILQYFRDRSDKTKKSLTRNIVHSYLISYMLYHDPDHFSLATLEHFIFSH